MRHLREPANGLTHLAGALLAVVALALLLRLAAGAGTAPEELRPLYLREAHIRGGPPS
jgi:predicted membrane channel-forming protein YqfA (hemolysin III family)